MEMLLVNLLVNDCLLFNLTNWVDLLVNYSWFVVLRDLSGVVSMLGGELFYSPFSSVHCVGGRSMIDVLSVL